MERISKEILLHIFSFLDLRDIVICSSVNNIWYDISNTNKVWRKFCNGNIYLTEYEDKRDPIHQTLKPMCYWKSCFINDRVITKNWLNKIYKTKNLIKLNPVCKMNDIISYKMANYDGKTLVICLTSSVKVYRIIKGTFKEVQTISISKGILLLLTSIYTNTLYISLNCGKIVIVYKLNDDGYYKEYVMFYKNVPSLTLQYTVIKLNNFEDTITKSFFSGSICNINSLLLGDFLYIFIEKKLYIWNLKDMICCKDMEAVRFLIAQDKNNIFISFELNNIIGFGISSKSFLTLNTDWYINKIYINENLLLALLKESITLSDETDKGKIIAWNKFTGEKFYETFLNDLEMFECCFIHPKLDILLNITKDNDMWAIQLKEMKLLWKRPVASYQNPFSDCLRSLGFRSLAADKFLISTLDLNKNYYLIDAKTGETLYCFDGDEIIYVCYDLLLLTDSFKKNIFIRQYF